MSGSFLAAAVLLGFLVGAVAAGLAPLVLAGLAAASVAAFAAAFALMGYVDRMVARKS